MKTNKKRDTRLGVMNYLHEITMKYPEAISFCSGRPPNDLCHTTKINSWLNTFLNSVPTNPDILLGQYGPTKGIINDHIAKMLTTDESLFVKKENILVTSGGQEAILMLLLALFNRHHDLLLCTDPTYIGVIGAAEIAGVEVKPVSTTGSFINNISVTLAECKQQNKNPKALYLIPDYDNPTGARMSFDVRKQLLAIAKENNLLIFEDTAYRIFKYDNINLPMLSVMDKNNLCYCIGSFSKTLFPGIRVGYVTTTDSKISELLSTIKSMITVNTSPILQSIVGGMLIENNYSLKKFNRQKVSICKDRRDSMLKCLEKEFPRKEWHGIVDWNHPAGGFFLTLSLPFDVTTHLKTLAKDFKVLLLPLKYVSGLDEYNHVVRLAYSNCSIREIRQGIARLSVFIKETIDKITKQ